MNRNQEEASDSCGAGVFETGVSEGKNLQLRQRHCELGDIVIGQLEGTLFLNADRITAGLYVQRGQVAKHLNRRGEGGVDSRVRQIFDLQELQRFFHLGQWCHALRGGNTAF